LEQKRIDRPFGHLYAKPMEIQLTPAQEAFLRQAIESGRIHRAEEAIQQALSLWEARERGRIEILSALDEAEGDLQTGNFSDYGDESLPRLGEELKREARSSLKSSSKG
jgi:Arc/MetJ-type ribon-helix-helix transcriptional regulator